MFNRAEVSEDFKKLLQTLARYKLLACTVLSTAFLLKVVTTK
jgi:hypothetical protein